MMSFTEDGYFQEVKNFSRLLTVKFDCYFKVLIFTFDKYKLKTPQQEQISKQQQQKKHNYHNA